MAKRVLTDALGALLFAQHALRLLNTSPPSTDNLEAYQLSLRSLAKSSKRITLIRQSNVHLSLSTAKLLRHRVRWSL